MWRMKWQAVSGSPHPSHLHHPLVNDRRGFAHLQHRAPELRVPPGQGAGHGDQVPAADQGLADIACHVMQSILKSRQTLPATSSNVF